MLENQVMVEVGQYPGMREPNDKERREKTVNDGSVTKRSKLMKLSDEEIGMVWGAIEFNYENCECASDYGNLCKGCRMWNKLVEGVS